MGIQGIALSGFANHIMDRSLFIAWGGGAGAEGFRRGILNFWGKRGGSVVTENPKGGIAENFEGIQTGDHSNLLGK